MLELKFFPPHAKLILLHTVVVLHYTHHIKCSAWSKGGGKLRYSDVGFVHFLWFKLLNFNIFWVFRNMNIFGV